MRLPSIGSNGITWLLTIIFLFSSIIRISAVNVKIRIDPTWLDYILDESENLEKLGKAIDGFKFDVEMDCSPGGHDIRHENGYWETLRALVDTIAVVHDRFSGVIQFIKRDQEGQDVLESYGLPNLQKAESILSLLDTWYKYLDRLIPFFRTRADVIKKTPGYRTPDTQTTGVNLRELSFRIESGRPDGQGNIVYSSDGRRKFYDQFRQAVIASEKLVKEIDKGIVWARTDMSGRMFDKLLRGRDPDNDEASETDEDGEEDGELEEEQEEGKGERNQENAQVGGGNVEGRQQVNQIGPVDTIEAAEPSTLAQQGGGSVVNNGEITDLAQRYTMEDNFVRIRGWFKCWGREALRLVKALDDVGAAPSLPYWVVINDSNGEVIPVNPASGG
ncbi:hypothetical protein TWF506_006534 [Arthrobotrys conoides]|uniref:Uncharacterized protein n=1 Tax=Arthrobotrys conoides TaxID=74498 RepID=A0AAN8NRW8_9PEZI